MSRFEELKAKNPSIRWIHADDPALAPYGRRVVADFSRYEDVVEKHIPVAQDGTYERSSPYLEELAEEREWLLDCVYGQAPIQIGYCCGHNRKMNGMEWHRGSEVNIAVTDAVLLLGQFGDVEIREDRMIYDSAKAVAVYLPKGYAVELYPMVLHFAPVEVTPDGFFVLVVLPQGTNGPLVRNNRDPYLFARDKWLLFHKDSDAGRDDISGDNIEIML